MGFSLRKLLTGGGSKLLDPIGLWGDGGKAAADAERQHKEAMAQAEIARQAAINQSEQTRAMQVAHEKSLAEIAANARMLSDSNQRDTSTNVIAGGSAGVASALMKKKKQPMVQGALSTTLGINI